ncbi:PTS sugar transporter subunit IIB [Candidatus Pantoea persica]
MKIGLARIDDRLIHGQVATCWNQGDQHVTHYRGERRGGERSGA